jgi:hypothetical protein
MTKAQIKYLLMETTGWPLKSITQYSDSKAWVYKFVNKDGVTCYFHEYSDKPSVSL